MKTYIISATVNIEGYNYFAPGMILHKIYPLCYSVNINAVSSVVCSFSFNHRVTQSQAQSRAEFFKLFLICYCKH